MAENQGGGATCTQARPQRPSVSVLLSVRDGADVVDVQLAALAEQDYPGWWEVVVVDDASTDGTLAAVAAWSDRLRLTVLRIDEARGASAGRNRARRAASGAFLAFCDHDDRVHRDWVSALVAAADDADVVAGVVDCAPLNDPVVRAWKDDRPRDRLVLAHGTLPAMIGASCGMWADVFDAVGGFDERITGHDDVDLAWRAQLAGYRLVHAPAAVADYRYRPSIRGLARQSFRRYQAVPYLLALHRGRLPAPVQRGDATGAIGTHVRLLVSTAPRAVVDRRVRGRWVHTAARIAGRAVGEVRLRTGGAEQLRPWLEVR